MCAVSDPGLDLAELAASLGDALETRFELGPRLSEGPYTEVYTARDRELGRSVLVKRARLDAPERELRRLLVEAQVAAQLAHPNVVPLYSLEVTADSMPAFTMQRVRGETLAKLVERARDAGDPRDGTHALRRRLEIFLGVTDAIAHAHARGVYHRKLTSAAVMLGPFAEVFVTDWGSAMLGEKGAAEPLELIVAPPISLSGPITRDLVDPAVRGRSPRDLAAELRDRRALGRLLAELVTLTSPVAPGTSDPAAPSTPPPPLARPQRRVPRDLRAIVGAAQRDDGYHDVRALAEDVRRFLHGEVTHARPTHTLEQAVRRALRRPAKLLLLLLLVVMSCGGFLLMRRVNALEAERADAKRREAVASVSGAVSARADQLDAMASDIMSELYAVRASLSLSRSSTTAREALRVATRRTSALRGFMVDEADVVVVGAQTTELHSLAPIGTADARWGLPTRRSPHEPWVVPVLADLTDARGTSRGVVGLDIPLASLTILTAAAPVPGLRALRVVDAQGRMLDGQGYTATPTDAELVSQVEARVESNILWRRDHSLALARVHTLEWYMVGETEVHP
jgi:serine/threonine protein kinase